MTKERLIREVNRVEKLSRGGKLFRLFLSPYKYLNAILFREWVYKRKKKSKLAIADTIIGRKMKIKLPAATDIYLTGGKTHDSELRLSRFMIHSLSEGDVYVDVGAHYGFFSLLASELVGQKGSVVAFEAAHSNFQILKQNCQAWQNINIHNYAISDEIAELTFYEFPALYSEYNTLDIDQFKDEDWFLEYPPSEHKIQALPLSKFLSENEVVPDMIKIDVEGAEDRVIKGLKEYLKAHSPIIIMEYLVENRQNRGHKLAVEHLMELGFSLHIIDQAGQIKTVKDLNNYMESYSIDSENIVFKRV